MIINNTIFNTDLETILLDLQAVLRQNGSQLLSTINRTQSDVMVSCPYHKDGMEKKPSMGIRKSDGKCHCFTCGSSPSFPEFVTYCLGYEDKSKTGAEGFRWLLRNYNSVSVEERKDVELDMARGKGAVSQSRNSGAMVSSLDAHRGHFVSEEELDTYRYYHPYWTKRKITNKDLIELFDLGYDKDTGCITFPVRDIDGNCLFVARRSVKFKYFNYPKGSEKPVYGLYELKQLTTQPDEIIVTESMIDALTCWQYGKYAVALNGLGNERQFKELRDLPCRKLILATDADDAGMTARKRIRKNVPNKIITEYVWNKEDAKDINDMSKEMFLGLQEVF